MEGQFNLFNLEDDNSLAKETGLKVVKATFDEQKRLSWQELFEGYDELYAITYSSGLQFVNQVIKKFKYAEVIFGSEETLDYSLEAVIASQIANIETICNNKSAQSLINKVNDNELKLFVSRDVKSHEKLFVLKSFDGRTRVITGSANMSASAFGGVQRENIIYFDDESAFGYYKTRFEDFKQICSDNISDKVLNRMVDGEEDLLRDNPENIPICEAVKVQKAIVLDSTDDEEVEIVADIKGLEDQIKPMLPKEKKQEKIVLTIEKVEKFKRKYIENRQVEKLKEKQLPKLHVDVEKEMVSFNGKAFNLNPEKEDINRDIKLYLQYMDSLSISIGDSRLTQENYYSFTNWYFASVFMPYLRLIGATNMNETKYFPMYGIIYGESNGGKTTIVRLLTKMMCGKTIAENSSSDFTQTNISQLKCGCEGVPIYIDDLAKDQYTNHNEKVIKDDNWGIRERFVNYPAVVITTNRLPSISSDISKRAFICRIDSKIDREEGLKNARRINESKKRIGTAFFCEYVRRMMPQVREMAENMKKASDDFDYFPDILLISSKTINEIMGEFVDLSNYRYVKEISFFDCVGEKKIGKSAMDKIMLAWENEPKQFKCDKKQNTLIYDFSLGTPQYEIRHMLDELPATLNARKTQTKLIMDLDKAQEMFGNKFKKKLFM